jgi:5-methylcytosine-specific restriction endonuclease McrA
VSRHKRARLATRKGPGFIRRLAERDGWACWLCKKPINPQLPRDADNAASLDHVMPLAHGGSNNIANLRLAHVAATRCVPINCPEEV